MGRRRRSSTQETSDPFYSRNLLGIETRNNVEEKPDQNIERPYSIPSKSWSSGTPMFILLVVVMVIGVVAWLYKQPRPNVYSEV